MEPAREDLTEALKRARELLDEPDGIANTDYRYALAMTENEFGGFLLKAGEPDEAVSRFDAAYSILAELWNQNTRIPYMENAMAAALIGRAEARLALPATHSDPNRLESARKDAEEARANLVQLTARFPDHYAFLGNLGRAFAILGRIALAREDRGQAKSLIESALENHKKALNANPDSPDELAAIKAIREEIKAIHAREAPGPPR
jgi:tetratricopeptide (TPR) repeat protein